MKKILFFLFFLFTFFNLDYTVDAMVLHGKWGEILKGDPQYDKSSNRYIQNFDPTNVDKIYMASFTDNTFSKVAKEKTWTDTAQRPFNGKTYFTCAVAYKAIYFDSSGKALAEIKFEADEVVNGTCDSGNGDDQLEPEPEEPGNNGSTCAAAICECIAELGETLGGTMSNISNTIGDSISNVNSSVVDNGKKIDTVNNNLETTNSNLNDLKEITTDIKDELQTDLGISEPQEIPVPPIITEGVLESNMPKDENKPFEDDTIYFKDEGDAPEPGPLPDIPEPEACWEEGAICREDDLNPEDELKKDKFEQEDELKKDKFKQEDELKKDKFDKEKELQKDNFEREKELQKDKHSKEDELKKDSFSKDDEMKKDKFERDEKYNQTNQMQRDNFYEQTW
jgi:hypothetical protein